MEESRGREKTDSEKRKKRKKRYKNEVKCCDRKKGKCRFIKEGNTLPHFVEGSKEIGVEGSLSGPRHEL